MRPSKYRQMNDDRLQIRLQHLCVEMDRALCQRAVSPIEDQVDARRRLAAVWSEIQRLPAKKRAVLEAHFAHDSPSTAAESLKISTEAFHKRLQRTRAALASAIGETPVYRK